MNVMIVKQEPYQIQREEGFLVGRETAKKIRDRIIRALESAPPNSLIPLDFSQITFLDFSSADELIVKLSKRLGSGDLDDKFLMLLNLTELARENVKAALELQSLACVHQGSNGKRELLGKIGAELAETYELAVSKGRITARDVLDRDGKTISAASNRLSKLRALGLIAFVSSEPVESGGRQNVFVAIY